KRFVTQSRKLLKARHEDARKTIIPMGSTISGQQKQQHRFHHPDPFNPKTTMGWNAALKEAEIPLTKFNQETEEGLRLGLPGASSIDDKTIPTFSRGELPHFAGINTFLKAPYIEDAKAVGAYDCAVVGVPFDGGCTYRAGTRFGPQGIRRISALYTPYNYEKGIDLREQMVNHNGIGGWQVPRPAVPNMIERETNIFTMDDIEKMGIDKVAEMALERAWDGCDAVYMSYDIDSIEAAFVPGTGWPEPGGLLPREALKLVGLIAKEGLCGMEVVEVSPPYDHADITSLMALRIIVDALGSMVSHGTLKKCMNIFDKEFVPI
ncbi:hypothetical protein ACHAXS_003409, partial [Conticribra weissflogii]